VQNNLLVLGLGVIIWQVSCVIKKQHSGSLRSWAHFVYWVGWVFEHV